MLAWQGSVPFLLAWLIGTTFSPISEDVVKSVQESFAKSFLTLDAKMRFSVMAVFTNLSAI
jgi:hypothetical protein